MSEIISDADRYYAGTIDVLDPTLGNLTLSLVLDAGDTEALLETLEAALPIRVHRLDDGTILLVSRP